MSEIFSSVLVLPADLGRLAVIETQVDELLRHAPPFAEADIVRYNIHLAVHELCVNIIKHAYGGAMGKFTLTLSLFDDPWRVEVSTCDGGSFRFDAEVWTPPDLDDLPVHGLGVFLIHSLMDEVSYAPDADCNHWWLLKRLPVDDDQKLAAIVGRVSDVTGRAEPSRLLKRLPVDDDQKLAAIVGHVSDVTGRAEPSRR